MTLELPAHLIADRVTSALAVASGVALEAMLTRHPGSIAGPGLVLGLILMAWQWRRTRRRPRRLEVGPSGVSLVFGPATAPVPADGRRARVLGRTVVLPWHDRPGPGSRQGTVWLTSADVPVQALRALRVALVAGRAAGR